MENATKALLIAAAILVAILIISLGLVVYNMASETVSGLNMTEAEITSFNDKFQQYEGTNITGSQVRALLKTINTNNITNKEDDAKQVTVSGVTKPADVNTGSRYTVTCTPNTTTGLITTISISENS